MKAKKSLGQHFLTSEAAVHHMVTVGGAKKGDTVLEIGPGKGVLTKALLATGANVIAVEKDSRMIGVLNETFAKEIENKQLTLVPGDILNINIEEVLRSSNLDADRGASADCDQNVLTGTLRVRSDLITSQDLERVVTETRKVYSSCKEQTQTSNKGMRQICRPYVVVANIPYYITGEIMRLFLESNTPPKSMTLLVQKEVAERIIARDKKESVLSLSVKLFGTPSLVSVVKRGSFFPIPNVDSAIIHIADISREKIGTMLTEHFFTIVKTGLAHKRKILISNLSSLYAKDTLSHVFATLSISEKVRGEDVDILTWIHLANYLPTTQN